MARCLALFIFCLVCAVTAEARPVQGSPGDDENVFRTATEDLYLDRSKLTSKVRRQLEEAKGKIVEIDFPAAAIRRREPVEAGLRNDCTELPSTEQLVLDTATKANSQMEFLRAIPKGTFQTFTFMKRSKSAQADKVDAMNPRILRMNKDGTVIFSYVCDPKSRSYGTVEMIVWNKDAKRFEFTHIDFRTGKQVALGAEDPHESPAHQKFEKNPQSCLNCHAPDPKNPDPVWNWGQYPNWQDAYGSSDDFLPSPGAYEVSIGRENGKGQEMDEIITERRDYERFLGKVENERKQMGDQGCLSGLPWPSPGTPGYELYPYSDVMRTNDYRLRPNLKLTDTAGHLMAQRIARKFLGNPYFQRVKYLMLQDSLGCPVQNFDARVRRLALPDFTPPEEPVISREDLTFMGNTSMRTTDSEERQARRRFHPGSRTGGTQNLHKFGELIGFRTKDWTMEYNADTPFYNPGILAEQSNPDPDGASIGQLAIGALLEQMAAGDPSLAAYGKKLSRGVEGLFGTKFSCIDDMGGVPRLNVSERSTLCSLLERKQRAQEKALKPLVEVQLMDLESKLKECEAVMASEPPAAIAFVSQLMEKMSEDSPEVRGMKAIKESCVLCHTKGGEAPKSLHFLDDFAAFQEHLARDKKFGDTLIDQVRSGDMPYFTSPKFLSPQEKADVEAFIRFSQNPK